MNGLIVGYVSITACCHNVETWAALIIGSIASILYEFSSRTLRRMDIDDPMDSISTHAIGGFWSLLALGIFDNQNGLLFSGSGRQLGVQLIGASVLMLMAVCLPLLFFYPLKKMGHVRFSKVQEVVGMDIYFSQEDKESEQDDILPASVFNQIEAA